MNTMNPGIQRSIIAHLNSLKSSVYRSIESFQGQQVLQKVRSGVNPFPNETTKALAYLDSLGQRCQDSWKYLAEQNPNRLRCSASSFMQGRLFPMQSFHKFFGKNFSFGSGGSGTNQSPGFSFPGSNAGTDIFNKMLEMCSKSHAQSIARRMNIEMKNIKFDVDGAKMNVTIDAPNATPLQIQELGRQVEEECPMARFYGKKNREMRWYKELTK